MKRRVARKAKWKGKVVFECSKCGAPSPDSSLWHPCPVCGSDTKVAKGENHARGFFRRAK